MQDTIIAGTGNSRYIRSSVAADATWADVLDMLRAGTFPIDMAGLNLAGFTQLGTALNKQTLLSDAVISGLELASDAVPSDALLALKALTDGKLPENQGMENAGKLIGVGEDGDVAYISIDDTPAQDSADPVSSGGVYGAISSLQQTMEEGKLDKDQGAGSAGNYMSVGDDGIISPTAPDTAPTESSNKLITSGAVYTAVAEVSETAKTAVSYALAAFPTDTASGAVAFFPDGADGLPVAELTVGMVPVQAGSGDPSPDNVRPISGRTGLTLTQTGKNLLPKGADLQRNGISFAVQSSGEVAVTGTATGNAFWGVEFEIPPGTYTLTGCPQGGGLSSFRLEIRDRIGGNVIEGIIDSGNGSTFSISEPLTAFVNIRIASGYAAPAAGLKISPMLRLASVTDAAFAPCASIAPLSLSWESEAGTVYAGTLEVTSGVLTARPYYAAYAGEALVGPWVSSLDVYAPGAVPTTGAQVVDLGGAETVYRLTAQEVKTLPGANSIWSNAGDTEVAYRVDPRLYISAQIKNTQNLIAGVEDAYTATQNYSIGDFFIVGNGFYRATSAIASGETITPGSNCADTTVAEQLKALFNS